MKKIDRIIKNIESDKDLIKRINKDSYVYNPNNSIDSFIENAERYIKAIKQKRILCSIDSVSRSGMSRTIKFMECAKIDGRNEFIYLNFHSFFDMMGYNPDRNGYSRITGCGMDMIFYTNYTIIHRLHKLGFITRKQCDILAQNTPQVI